MDLWKSLTYSPTFQKLGYDFFCKGYIETGRKGYIETGRPGVFELVIFFTNIPFPLFKRRGKKVS